MSSLLSNFVRATTSANAGPIVFQSYDPKVGKVSRIKQLSQTEVGDANIVDVLASGKTALDNEFSYGGRTMRPIKRMIYKNATGICYVIKNAKSPAEQIEAQDDFSVLMTTHTDLNGVPLLLLIVNDTFEPENVIESSKTYLEIAEAFNVAKNVKDRPWKMQLVSSLTDGNAELKSALSWLAENAVTKQQQITKAQEEYIASLQAVGRKRKATTRAAPKTGDAVKTAPQQQQQQSEQMQEKAQPYVYKKRAVAGRGNKPVAVVDLTQPQQQQQQQQQSFVSSLMQMVTWK